MIQMRPLIDAERSSRSTTTPGTKRQSTHFSHVSESYPVIQRSTCAKNASKDEQSGKGRNSQKRKGAAPLAAVEVDPMESEGVMPASGLK